MNVGSILNGDPPDHKSEIDVKGVVDARHRQSINDLLNDSPAARLAKQMSPSDQSVSSITSDVDEVEETSEILPPKDENDGVKAEKDTQKKTQQGKQSEGGKSANSEKGTEKPRRNSTAKKDAARKPAARSKQAKPNLVGSELERINNLKIGPKKPHRYAEPPVWAQEWIPPSHSGREHAPVSNPTTSGSSASGLLLKSVFDRSNAVSTDLECLVTGVIPPQSVVRTVAEWIYANFIEIPLENRPFVELELKFGTIVDKASGVRLDIGVSTECIFTNSSSIRFDMGVHEVGWSDMRAFLDELEKKYQDENRKNGPPGRPRRKFNVLETDNTDLFFQITERNEVPKRIRITRDNALNPPRYTGIEKKRVSDLYIFNPLSMYDLRLSLSMEFPVPEGSVEHTVKGKPSLTRIKRRTSLTHAPTATQFDFTVVQQPQSSKNKLGKTVVEHSTHHELELEMDTAEIFKGFDKIRDGSDTIRFEELVEVFLNNARCLNNRVTKLALK